jgi:hypothetical protein
LSKAARDAGIDPIIQIKEPEAAALFALQSATGASAGLQVNGNPKTSEYQIFMSLRSAMQ